MFKKTLSVLLILVLTVSLVPFNFENFNGASFAAPVKVTSAKIMVDGKEFTWDKAKYGKEYIHRGKYVYVPLKAFTTAFNLKYRLEAPLNKGFGYSYLVVIDHTLFYNTSINGLMPKLTEEMDEGGLAMVNNQIYISISELQQAAVKTMTETTSGSVITVRFKTPSVMSRIKEIQEIVKPLLVSVAIDYTETPDEGFRLIEIGRLEAFKPGEGDYKDGKFFRSYGNFSFDEDGISFSFNKQDDEAYNKIMALTKHYLGDKASLVESEYLKYFVKQGEEIKLDQAAIGSDFTSYEGYQFKESADKTRTYLVFQKHSRIALDLSEHVKTMTDGSISYSPLSEYYRAESTYLRNNTALVSMFEKYVKNNYGKLDERYHTYFNDPSLNLYGTKASDLTPSDMKLIVRPMEILLVQDLHDGDDAYYHERSMFDLLHANEVWESYAVYVDDKAVGITLGMGLPNYTQLAKDLITYTTGNKEDAAEIIGHRDTVMKAYYKHAIKTGDTDGYKFNTDVYPYVNKPYKLKSGTVVYMDFHDYYMSSVGPTVYIQKDFKEFKQSYAKDGYDDPYSDYIFSNWRTYDEKGREVRTSAPKFSWGKYAK